MINLINLIKNYSKGKNKMGYQFPTFKVAQIEKLIDVTKEAIQDGQNNIPRADSQTFSICENEAIAKCDELRQNEVSKASQYLATIKNSIIEKAADLGKKHFFIDNIKASIEHTIADAKGKLSPLVQSFKNEQRHVQNYKLEHKITREPHTLTPMSTIISLGVIALLFYFEMELNTRLLAPAMKDGLMGGKAVASAVAMLNVFVSFGAGYLFIKNIHHVDKFKKRLAQIGLFVYTIFIIYINGLMGAFRATAESANKVKKWGSSASDSTTQAVTDYGNELFWFMGSVSFDVYPLILTFIGIMFAIASLWDGYLFDDPYPGYGKVGKKRNENFKEIERLRHALVTEVISKFNKEIKDTSNTREKLIKLDINSWSKDVINLENTFENYKRFATQIDDGIDHCLGEYRANNNKYRTTEEPKYWFDKDGKMRTRYYDLAERKKDPKIVFQGHSSLYLEKNEIEQQLEKYQNKITEEANQYLNNLNSYQEETNKIIEKILKDYEVNKDA